MYDNQSIHSPIKATYYILLLLLSRFSRVRLYATPQTAAHQAPPSLGFSGQEHWSRLPFPSPMHESEKWKWSRSVCPTLRDPMDCSLPGSSIHGIFQARILEWVAIAFSRDICVCMCKYILKSEVWNYYSDFYSAMENVEPLQGHNVKLTQQKL